MPQLNRATNELQTSALHLADLGIEVIPLWWPEGNTMTVLHNYTNVITLRG